MRLCPYRVNIRERCLKRCRSISLMLQCKSSNLWANIFNYYESRIVFAIQLYNLKKILWQRLTPEKLAVILNNGHQVLEYKLLVGKHVYVLSEADIAFDDMHIPQTPYKNIIKVP